MRIREGPVQWFEAGRMESVPRRGDRKMSRVTGSQRTSWEVVGAMDKVWRHQQGVWLFLAEEMRGHEEF